MFLVNTTVDVYIILDDFSCSCQAPTLNWCFVTEKSIKYTPVIIASEVGELQVPGQSKQFWKTISKFKRGWVGMSFSVPWFSFQFGEVASTQSLPSLASSRNSNDATKIALLLSCWSWCWQSNQGPHTYCKCSTSELHPQPHKMISWCFHCQTGFFVN